MKSWESLPLVHPDDLGLDALVHMAGTSKGCGCLLVVNDKRQLLGTFADADLRRALTQDGEKVLKLRVKDLMNFNKEFPRTIAENALAYEAQKKMEGKMQDYLPVVSSDEGQACGSLDHTSAHSGRVIVTNYLLNSRC